MGRLGGGRIRLRYLKKSETRLFSNSLAVLCISFPNFVMMCWNVVKMEQRVGHDS